MRGVSRSLLTRVEPTLAIAAVAAVGPGALIAFIGHDRVDIGATTHFVGVGLSASAAAAASLGLTIVGARRGDGRTVLLGTAFSVMAALLAVHGLATPGVVVGPNGVVSLAGGATLPVGGALLALSAVPPLRRPRRMSALLALQGALIAAVLALGLLGLLVPAAVPPVPEPGDPLALAALAAGAVFYGVLALRAIKTYVLTRRRADLLVVVGLGWLIAALPGALLLDFSRLGFWLGHGFELIGIVLVAAPVAVDLHRAAQSRPLAGDLRAAELVSTEEAFLGAHVRALTVRLAEKDEYTEQHTRRVALRAVQIGEALGLPRRRLRVLATGGLLHDIGKLSVPDAILKKPGPLDDAEYDVVRRHPFSGDRLLGELGGFTDDVRRLVRNHHERLDGYGYPGGLRADELDLDTRILTVCDVYDALLSPRVYRPAWRHDDALEYLRANVGSAFDARCVDALERVLEREERAGRRDQRGVLDDAASDEVSVGRSTPTRASASS